MAEYRRERNTLETQLKKMTQTATFHNDHLRIIDAWFTQVSLESPFFSLITQGVTNAGN